jgi:hypothetical protein
MAGDTRTTGAWRESSHAADERYPGWTRIESRAVRRPDVARSAVLDYIEVVYNRERLHSALGYRYLKTSPRRRCLIRLSEESGVVQPDPYFASGHGAAPENQTTDRDASL